MIIQLSGIPEEDSPGNDLKLKRVVTAEDTASLSVTWVRLSGRHQRIVNAGCDRAYYVIEGSARFQVGDGTPIESVSAGDFIYIPRGTPYEFEGEMTYVVVNGPAFTPGSDQVLPSVFA